MESYQFINWPLFITVLMEEMVCTQEELAKTMQTTQQTISHWLTGFRNPIQKHAEQFAFIAACYDVDIYEYEHSKRERQRIAKLKEFKQLPKKIRDLTKDLTQMHPRKRNRILGELKDMLNYYEEKNR